MEAHLQAELASAAMAQATEQRRQYENRIADLKDASEQRAKELLRTVRALAEEVEFLRSKHFGAHTVPPVTRDVPVTPEEFDFMPTHNTHWLSEEEEEIEALRAGGHLDQGEYGDALAQIRALVGGPVQIET